MENNNHKPIVYRQIWRDEDGTLLVGKDHGGGMYDIESILSTELEPVGPPQNLYAIDGMFGEVIGVDTAVHVTYPQMKHGELTANVYAFFKAHSEEDTSHYFIQFYRVERLAEMEVEESSDSQES